MLMTMKKYKLASCTGAFAVLAFVLSVSIANAEPLRLDFSRTNPDGVAPLQAGWSGFSAEGDQTRSYPNDELAGVGNSVDVSIAGQCCSRDYAPATGMFAPSSDLLRDGPLLNGPGTLTLTLEGLLDGTYLINSYHHTTLNGPSDRGPATPFDIRLTDGVVSNSVIASGLITSDNGSSVLGMETFSFQVVGGSPVVIDYIRGANVGGGDHFALPAIEIYTAANQPPPIELIPPPDPPPTDVLNIDFSQSGGSRLQEGFNAFVANDAAGPGQTVSSTKSFAYDNGVGGTADVTLTGTITGASGDFVYRNYDPATGIFEPLDPLLHDGPLVNNQGTITLGLDNLEDGLYDITLYHHTTRFGPNHVSGTDVRGPATPFDVLLTDGSVTDSLVVEDGVMSDNGSDALSTSTFQFSVVAGSAVSIDIVRGPSVGGPDHMALAGFEVTQVPEPASILLLSLGAIVWAAGFRRRSRLIVK